jgi:hypothetical protein
MAKTPAAAGTRFAIQYSAGILGGETEAGRLEAQFGELARWKEEAAPAAVPPINDQS